MGKLLAIGTFTPIKLHNNPLASCSVKISIFYHYTLHILIKASFFCF